MQRLLIWLGSAVVAVIVYALAQAVGLSHTLTYLVTFAGAMAGATLTSAIILRGAKPPSEMQAPPAPPPDRGNGKTGA